MLDRDAIEGALKALDAELGAQGVRANLFVVGGAILLVLSGKRPPRWAGKGYVRAVEEVVVDARRRSYGSHP